jgi:hypothetical protein
MNARPSLTIGAALVLGCVILGLFLGQPSAGQAPAVPAKAEGRYQMLLVGKEDIIVCDTATGKCWIRPIPGHGQGWFDLGTPVKKK